MIENRFIHINEKETFEELKPEIQDSSIAFCKESGEIVTHKENYGKAKWEVFPVPKNMPVVLINKITGKKKISKHIKKFNPDEWTPIGIIVIPKEHDVYGTGEGAMLSLKYMRYDTPEEDGVAQRMHWGPNKVLDVTRISKPSIGSDNLNESPTIISNTSDGCFPSDKFQSVISGQDPLVGYGKLYDMIPSPYLKDGSRNPLYYDTEIVTDNVLSFYNGKEVSEKAWNKIDESIKNQDSITNTANYYPAFWACHKYYTLGTEQGDWFLPSAGEIGYMMARFNAINLAINEINKVWADCVEIQNSSIGHWSASEANFSTSWFLYTSTGVLDAGNYYKQSNSYYVRAFCRIKY